MLLVLNKVPSGVDRGDLLKQMDDTYGAETVALLPLDEDVVRNASSDLFSLTQPRHEWSEQIRVIAERVRA